MNIVLEPGASALLDALHRADFAAYAVGGCVRDSLLGLAPHDWDLCTAARPEQVMELFGEKQCIPTGLQHGTVTVKRDGRLYEITTFRTEGSYSDGRHPDSVAFVPDVREDLARRDFTINAMAYSAEEGLCDPFGGQEDLARGVVRAVGEPLRRFEEDALRILRLYRFAARFGFVIDEATEAAAKQLAAHLDCVSVERIEEELDKLLSAPKPGAYLEPEVLAFVLPELPPDYLSEAREIIDALPAGGEEVTTRWAALLLPLGEDGTRKALKRLKCSNAVIDGVATLVKECGAGVRGAFSSDTGRGIPSPALLPAATGSHPPDGPQRNSRTGLGQAPAVPDTAIRIRKLLGRYDLHTVQRLAALGAAMEPEQAADFAAQAELAAQLDADGVCCRVSQLAVNGRDLMAAGIPAGPGLRRTLEALLDAVVRGQLPNERQRLLDAAGQISAS
mgnify:CR=1 FL=1